MMPLWGRSREAINANTRASDAAAPAGTLRFVQSALPMGSALLVPSLWLLFPVFKKDRARQSFAHWVIS